MNNFADNYFQKVNTFEQKIFEPIPQNLKIITIIPVYNEPNLSKTIKSLIDNLFEDFFVEVIFVINSSVESSEDVKNQNLKTLNEIKNYSKLISDKKISFFVLHYPDLPKKKSGAGVARKIGMDEALRRFSALNKPDGIIVSLDADTLVEKNYYSSIYSHFKNNPKTSAANINFEHITSGPEFDEKNYKAISIYELYLRYYVQALRFTGFPFAFHTIGSAFCFLADIYAKQGGMVTNLAGEDFYFLQKIIPVSNFSEIKTTTVYPSPRITDRVLFGTGIAVNQIINDADFDYKVYNLDAFVLLADFFKKIPDFYENKINFDADESNKILLDFLNLNEFKNRITEISENTSSFNNFRIRFFRWFNAFKIVKFLNYSHENYLKKQSAVISAKKLLEILNINSNISLEDMLKKYRDIQNI